jgi:hypothetical protein
MLNDYRVIINQAGMRIELHGNGYDGACLVALSPSRMEQWGSKLVTEHKLAQPSNIGQLAMAIARELVTQPYLVSGPWTYNASTEEYSRA